MYVYCNYFLANPDKHSTFVDGFTPFGTKDGLAVSHGLRSRNFFREHFTDDKRTVINGGFQPLIHELQRRYPDKELLFRYSE